MASLNTFVNAVSAVHARQTARAMREQVDLQQQQSPIDPAYVHSLEWRIWHLEQRLAALEAPKGRRHEP